MPASREVRTDRLLVLNAKDIINGKEPRVNSFFNTGLHRRNNFFTTKACPHQRDGQIRPSAGRTIRQQTAGRLANQRDRANQNSTLPVTSPAT